LLYLCLCQTFLAGCNQSFIPPVSPLPTSSPVFLHLVSADLMLLTDVSFTTLNKLI
jgi:hypothetical protein